jgi:hypothetical protein
MFIQAFVGSPSTSPPQSVGRECLDMDAVLARVGGRPVEMLHMDVQGAELAFIRSMRRAVGERKLRFAVISTHHESISGSATTHEDCLGALQSLGATVLAEHDVFQSYSGDGLIVASFSPADRSIELPTISRNVRERSLFRNAPRRAVPAVVSPPPRVQTPPPGWLRRQVAKFGRSCRKRLRSRGDRQVA